jgi:signal transduction histidine kinase
MPSQPAPVLVDRDRITQVVINLLSNAAKFCESKQGQILVRITDSSKDFKVEIQDNGPGISRDHVEHIFEKFHQVSDEQAGKPKGTGLGLAISQRIVEHHGGRIWVESTGPDGTTFAFVLPETTSAQREVAAQ